VKVKHKFIPREHGKSIYSSIAFLIKANEEEHGVYELYRQYNRHHNVLHSLALTKKKLIEQLKDKGKIV
jgi:hypothetical protein